MDRTIIINCFNLNDYMFKPLSEGISPADMLVQKIKSAPFQGEILEIHPSHQKLTLGFSRCQAPQDSLAGFWQAVKESLPKQGETWIIQANQPFLDLPILEEMMGLHHKFYGEYTFADAWPLGLSGDLIRNSIIDDIFTLALSHKGSPEDTGLFEIVQTDINRFDLETHIPPMDYRPWRLDFSVGNQEGWQLVKTFIELGYQDSGQLEELIVNHEDKLRLIPSYIQIQLSEQCPQSCSYCPYPQMNPQLLKPGKLMEPESFRSILEKIEKINPQAQISLSPWGEASLNPHVYDFISLILEKGFSLLVETSGLGWDREKIKPLLNRGKQHWILSMDSQDPGLYKKLRGDGQEEALNFLEFLESNADENVYCQVVRMKENEEDLEHFYTTLLERKAELLVQKYDDFSKRLPHKKITDLSPVKRFPCWHIKRDLVILVDGTVPRCREDINRDFTLGNVLKEDLMTLWQRGTELYLQQIKGEYPQICGDCDEYYCYNF